MTAETNEEYDAMDAAAQIRTSPDDESTDLAGLPRVPTSDRVVDFSASIKDRLLQNAGDAGKRDWSSALDLVSEAFEAIRMADERAAASEEYQAELVQRHADHVRTLEARLAASEKRADIAENRAKVAEGWLSKFHDTIIDEFKRTFTARQVER